MTGEEDMTNKFAVSILLCHQLSDVELILVFPQFWPNQTYTGI